MSAYVLDPVSWTNLADILNFPGPAGMTPAEYLKIDWKETILDWYWANDLAVSSRYRIQAGGFPPVPAMSAQGLDRLATAEFIRVIRTEKPEPLIQAIKTVQCLRYQCSEDVPESKRELHESRIKGMNDVIRLLGERLAECLPSYDEAEWG
jgi:hypothetical protein